MAQTVNVEIDIADAISSNLFLRESAIDFFKDIENRTEAEVIIDFASVDFMNRSFAHEYLTQKSKSAKMISETHVSEDVQNMLDIVLKVHQNEFKKDKADQRDTKLIRLILLNSIVVGGADRIDHVAAAVVETYDAEEIKELITEFKMLNLGEAMSPAIIAVFNFIFNSHIQNPQVGDSVKSRTLLINSISEKAREKGLKID
ncbi:MAG: DUF4325 domain-containing protein [Methanimicrococcus sp.]|nr:DUF4325 domain-containing protein [Methanimicrococcus sp.]